MYEQKPELFYLNGLEIESYSSTSLDESNHHYTYLCESCLDKTMCRQVGVIEGKCRNFGLCDVRGCKSQAIAKIKLVPKTVFEVVRNLESEDG